MRKASLASLTDMVRSSASSAYTKLSAADTTQLKMLQQRLLKRREQ